ncbi:MAG: AEC family transporter, partial [Nitrospirales bacterium]|nr:AEC family transporter [Nitrospirales bacterium]
LVTDFALPAIIFSNLSQTPFLVEKLFPAVLMLASVLICLVIVLSVGFALNLDWPVLGSLALVTGFGSSSTVGYSLVNQVFGANSEAMTNAIIIGEFGNCVPVFTLGVAIAVFFGKTDSGSGHPWVTAKAFFYSPIFVATILGLIAASLTLSQDALVVGLLYQVLNTIGDTLIVLVAITIGLLLKPIGVRTIIPLLGIVAGLKLLVEPALAGWGGIYFGIPDLEREVLVLETAMPAGTVSAVIAARYGCDGPIASTLVIATYLFSLITLPLMFFVTL